MSGSNLDGALRKVKTAKLEVRKIGSASLVGNGVALSRDSGLSGHRFSEEWETT
jgi:hypothetical protein